MPMKRDRSNKVLCGVCAGLGNAASVDPTVVRLAFVLLSLMGFGLPIVIYVILAIVMPS